MKTKEIPETNLDGLIRRIKEEGLEEARKKTKEITVSAEERASEVVEEAREEAEAILKEAEEARKREEEAGKKALKQAARDTVLRVKESLMQIFDIVLKEETGKILSGKELEKIIIRVIDGWIKDRDEGVQLEILLNEKERKTLEDFFLSKYKQKLKTGIEVNVHPRIEKGFHVGEKGNNFYYDFTDEGISDVLAAYLTPKLAEILDSGKERKEGKERE
ncbi:MAG: hypothetical protein SWO11_18675 [Thermodesulfobacteriota bacterium]|nr:hypothetical protein [Thermodesulfobacteriota bacterium]